MNKDWHRLWTMLLPLALVPVQDLVHGETLCEAFRSANLEQTSLAFLVSYKWQKHYHWHLEQTKSFLVPYSIIHHTLYILIQRVSGTEVTTVINRLQQATPGDCWSLREEIWLLSLKAACYTFKHLITLKEVLSPLLAHFPYLVTDSRNLKIS